MVGELTICVCMTNPLEAVTITHVRRATNNILLLATELSTCHSLSQSKLTTHSKTSCFVILSKMRDDLKSSRRYILHCTAKAKLQTTTTEMKQSTTPVETTSTQAGSTTAPSKETTGYTKSQHFFFHFLTLFLKTALSSKIVVCSFNT